MSAPPPFWYQIFVSVRPHEVTDQDRFAYDEGREFGEQLLRASAMTADRTPNAAQHFFEVLSEALDEYAEAYLDSPGRIHEFVSGVNTALLNHGLRWDSSDSSTPFRMEDLYEAAGMMGVPAAGPSFARGRYGGSLRSAGMMGVRPFGPSFAAGMMGVRQSGPSFASGRYRNRAGGMMGVPPFGPSFAGGSFMDLVKNVGKTVAGYGKALAPVAKPFARELASDLFGILGETARNQLNKSLGTSGVRGRAFNGGGGGASKKKSSSSGGKKKRMKKTRRNSAKGSYGRKRSINRAAASIMRRRRSTGAVRKPKRSAAGRFLAIR